MFNFLKQKLTRETPEEKAAREAKVKAEQDAALAKAQAERQERMAAEAAKRAGAAPTSPTVYGAPPTATVYGATPAASPTAADASATAAPAPAASTSAAPVPDNSLSHEQQLKQQAMAAQAAQQAALAQQLALARAAQQQQTPAAAGPPPPCQDCENNPAVVRCEDCDVGTAGNTCLFCAECDTAFHRLKRASHVRKPLPAPAPAQTSAVTASAAPEHAPVVGTFVPLGADPSNPEHVAVLRDSNAAPQITQAVQSVVAQPVTPPDAASAAAEPFGAAQPVATMPATVPAASAAGSSVPETQAAPFSSSFALSSPSAGTSPQSAEAAPQPQQQQQPSQPFQPQLPATMQPEPFQQPQPHQQEQQQQLAPLQQGFIPGADQAQQQLPQQMQPQQFQQDFAQQQQMQQQQLQQQQPQFHQAQQQQEQQLPYQQQQQQQPQQFMQQPMPPQQQEQRPFIPSMQLGAAQAYNQQQLQQQQQQQLQQPQQLQAHASPLHSSLTPRGGGHITPRNADGSVNFDARHRTQHTPRSQAALDAQHHQHQQSSTAPAPASLLSAEQQSEVAALHEDEIAELREMFARYDVNGDAHLALDEVSSFLHELEFTYSEDFIRFLINHVCGLHIHERTVTRAVGAPTPQNAPGAGASTTVRSIKGMLTFPEFLEFMRVFYWLHDAVVLEIERQFEQAFSREVNDDIVAILCRFVSFNEHSELDFNTLNRKLVEAVNAEADRAREEAEEAARIASGGCGDGQHDPASSPLAAQHLAQQRREDESRAEELARIEECRRNESEQARASRQREEEEKQALLQQREQYRSEAQQTQQQQSATGGEYNDINDNQRARPFYTQQQANDDDDPFAAHDKDASHHGSVSVRAGPAALLALSLDASDENFLRNSWTLLLKHFDRSRSGGINAADVSQAFRAMGLDPSEDQLAEFFQRADLDGSGSLSYDEFKQYYSSLFNAFLRRGLDLSSLRRIFKQFDEDGDGRVTLPEFRHVLRQICPRKDVELSNEDIERLCKLADKNNDGEVDFKEFLDLIRLSTGEHPPALTNAAGDDRARHETMMSFHAARALTRKIIRAHMPSPTEHIMSYAHMPSTFRASILARYQTREEFFPSSILNPVLHASGMHYEQMQMDPRSRSLRPAPLNATTGAPLARTSFHAYHIEVEHASGIPLPADVAHRNDIVARRVRVCILEGAASSASPLSNLYMIKGEWLPSEEDRWNFSLKNRENEWNSFLVKTDARDATVLFELTVLVKKPGQQQEKRGAPVSESSFIEMSCGFATLELDLSTPLVKETRLSRGILGGNLNHQVAIKDSEILARRSGFKAFTQMFSGPVRSQLSLKITPMGALGNERVQNYARFIPCNLLLPLGSLEVVKLFLELLAAFVLPPEFQPLHMGSSSQVALQMLLRPSSGVVDTPDLLQVLGEAWTEARRGIKKAATREHDTGSIVHMHASQIASADSAVGMRDQTSAHLLRQFRKCVLRLLPAMSMAPGVLPPLIVGLTDLKRLSVLRALTHVAEPLAVLTADGMLPGGGGSGGGGMGSPSAMGPVGGTLGVTRAPMSLARAPSVQAARNEVAATASASNPYSGAGGPWRSSSGASAQGGDGATREDGSVDPYGGRVEFRHLYAPFHTREVAFDPTAHSEEHHYERRHAIRLELQASGAGAPAD